MEAEDKKKGKIAVIDNQLARAEFSGDQSVLCRRIMFSAIAQIDSTADRLEAEYTVNLGELGAQNRHEAVRLAWKIADRLQSIKVKTALFDDKWKGGYLLAVVMPSVKYNADGTLGIKFNEDLRGFLCDLQTRFTQIKIAEFIKLTSYYQQRLCEFLCSYRLCKNKVPVKLDDLYSFLAVPIKMRVWYSFQQRILRPAVDKINELTTMVVKYKKEKGKDSIEFTLGEKNAIYGVLKQEAIDARKAKKKELNKRAYEKRKLAKQMAEIEARRAEIEAKDPSERTEDEVVFLARLNIKRNNANGTANETNSNDAKNETTPQEIVQRIIANRPESE